MRRGASISARDGFGRDETGGLTGRPFPRTTRNGASYGGRAFGARDDVSRNSGAAGAGFRRREVPIVPPRGPSVRSGRPDLAAPSPRDGRPDLAGPSARDGRPDLAGRSSRRSRSPGRSSDRPAPRLVPRSEPDAPRPRTFDPRESDPRESDPRPRDARASLAEPRDCPGFARPVDFLAAAPEFVPREALPPDRPSLAPRPPAPWPPEDRPPEVRPPEDRPPEDPAPPPGLRAPPP